MNQTAPVTRSHIAWIAAVLWIALLAGVIGLGLVSGRLGDTTPNLGSQGEPGALSALVAADPSSTPSASTEPGRRDSKPARGQGFLGGRGGLGGAFGGPGFGGPRGGITIASITGSQLSLKTLDGWSRTIDASGATIHNGRQTATLSDLKVGDQIAFRQTRNTDGTFTITDITIIQPQVTGTVGSVNGATFTVKLADGTSTTVQTDGSTSFKLAGKKSATIADLGAGLSVHVTGRRAADGSITATSVNIAPVVVAGQVTAKTATSITIDALGGKAVTIQVNASTTYQARANASVSLSDVAVDGWIVAQGALSPDGSLAATTIRLVPGGKAGGNSKGRGFGGGPSPVGPGAPPAPAT